MLPILKKPLAFIIFCFWFFSITQTQGIIKNVCQEQNIKLSPQFFLGKDAYKFPVYEELFLEDKVKVADIDSAFKAYIFTHNIGEYLIKKINKKISKAYQQADLEGYIYSAMQHYKELISFRKKAQQQEGVNLPLPLSHSVDILNEEDIQTYFSSAPDGSLPIANAENKGQWKQKGSFGNPQINALDATGNGAVDYIAFHPTNAAIMYSCAENGGLWKTIDYGNHWKPMTFHLPGMTTNSVEVASQNPNILYLAQADRIWVSKNEGLSWQLKMTGIDASTKGEVNAMSSDPDDAGKALIATQGGIYYTSDTGNTWTRKVTGFYNDLDVTKNWDLIVVSKEGKTSPTISYSIDKGVTWSEFVISSSTADITDKVYLGLHKPTSGKTIVYAFGLQNWHSPTRYIALWKSYYTPSAIATERFNFKVVKHQTYTYPNGLIPLVGSSVSADGLSFTSFHEATADGDGDGYGGLLPTSGSSWIGDFWTSQTDSNLMLIGREKIWGSKEGGLFWSLKPSYGIASWADNRYFASNITNDTLYICNDGGMWAMATADLFKIYYDVNKFLPKNGNIGAPLSTQMDVSKYNKGTFMNGGQDLGMVFERNGRKTGFSSVDKYKCKINDYNDAKLWAERLKIKIPSISGDDRYVYNIINDKFDQKRIYGYASGPDQLVRSPLFFDGWNFYPYKTEENASQEGTFTSVNNKWELVDISTTGSSNYQFNTFEQSWANKEMAFWGNESTKKLFKCNNLSAAIPNWVEITSFPKASRYRIATTPLSENIIAVATNNGVYLSKDGGINWVKKDGFPETDIKSILLGKTDDIEIYVQTNRTIYYISESSTTWKEFNRGLPIGGLNDIRMAHYANGQSMLYSSIYGTGAWESPMASTLTKYENKPIVQFSMWGKTIRDIARNNTITFWELCNNTDSIAWTFQSTDTIIYAGNDPSPNVKFPKEGLYTVTLKGFNANGSNQMQKQAYIKVGGVVTTLVVDTPIFISIDKTSIYVKGNFTSGTNIKKMGFLYSNKTTLMTVDNADMFIIDGATTNADFKATLPDLTRNSTYNIMPFVLDTNGYKFGAVRSATLPASNSDIPALSINVLNLGNSRMQVLGYAFSSGILPDSAIIEYGTSIFSDSVKTRLFATSIAYTDSSKSFIQLPIPLTGTYKFRMKLIIGGISYFSNIVSITFPLTYCLPSSGYTSWYEVINQVSYKGVTKNSSAVTVYEDFYPSVTFNAVSGSEDSITVVPAYTPWWITYSVYIDLNNDGVLNNANELIIRKQTPDSYIKEKLIIPIKDIVFNQKLRMRVASIQIDACNNGGDEQAEDYGIIITPPKPIITAVVYKTPSTLEDVDSVVLTSSIPSGILWSNGVVSQSTNITTTGRYFVTYTNENAGYATSDTIQVNILRTLRAKIIATDTLVCPNTSVTFTAIPTNAGSSISYQWKLNGIDVGTNSQNYTSNALVNGDVLNCILTSGLSTTTSNSITMSVGTSIAPMPTFNYIPNSFVMQTGYSNNSGQPIKNWGNCISATFSISGNPVGVSINSTTGIISWDGTQAEGIYPLTITATNSSGSATCIFVLSIKNQINKNNFKKYRPFIK